MMPIRCDTGSEAERFDADVALARAAARGERAAGAALVSRLVEPVRRTMMYLTGNRSEAEDLAQTTLVLILDKADSYRGESSLEHWASRVAVRIAIRQIRKWRRRDELDKQIEAPVAPFARPDEAIARDGLRQRLAGLLAKLSPKHRAAIVMFHAEGWSIPEIAEAIGVPVNTVRHRLQVGRKRLRALASKDAVVREWIEVQVR